MKMFACHWRRLMVIMCMAGICVACSPETEDRTGAPPAAALVPPKKADIPEKTVTAGEKTAPRPVMETAGTTGPAPAEMVLRSGIFETLTKAPVPFTHERHATVHNISCKDCHHVYEGGKNIWEQGMAVRKCEACHDETTIKDETKLPPEIKAANLKLAFHENCRTCHRAVKKEDPESTAPVTCNQCHKQ